MCRRLLGGRLVALQDRVDRRLEVFVFDVVGLRLVVHGAHVGNLAVLVQDEELRRVNGAVILSDLLGFVIEVRKRKLLGGGLLLHGIESIGGDRVYIDRDEGYLVLVLLGEGDDAILVLLGTRTAIAREDDNYQFLALEVGQRVLLVVGPRQVLPGRRRIAHAQRLV